MRQWIRLVLVAGALLASGCTSAPLPPARPLQAGDLQRLGGMWAWTARPHSPAGLGSGPVRVRVADGLMRFETATATGTLTLHEGDGRRILDGQAVSKSGGQPFPVQFTQRGSTDLRGTADGALVWFAFVVEN